MLVLDVFNKLGSEDGFETSSNNLNIAESELKTDVLPELHQVGDSQKYGVHCIFNDVLSEEAGRSNGHWVAVNHLESLLEDWMLADWRSNLFLPKETSQVLLQEWVNYKTRSHFMHVFALRSLFRDVLRSSDGLHRYLWQFSLDVKGERSEFPHIDTLSASDFLKKVLDEWFPDDEHLWLRFERFARVRSSLSRVVVFPWVGAPVL